MLGLFGLAENQVLEFCVLVVLAWCMFDVHYLCCRSCRCVVPFSPCAIFPTSLLPCWGKRIYPELAFQCWRQFPPVRVLETYIPGRLNEIRQQAMVSGPNGFFVALRVYYFVDCAITSTSTFCTLGAFLVVISVWGSKNTHCVFFNGEKSERSCIRSNFNISLAVRSLQDSE